LHLLDLALHPLGVDEKSETFIEAELSCVGVVLLCEPGVGQPSHAHLDQLS
jgi:hypothetical protein